MTNSSSDPLVGRTVGQYRILARIGGGGMGVVYTARASRLGRVVALKFLPAQWSHDESAKQRFVREAQAASATNHPNICTIHDIETADDGQLFIVMAYYDGQTLKKRLESGPLPIEEALDIATQVAEGLAKAHASGVVHRDIKPGNLILTEDGVRILDFGLATLADAMKLTVENAPLGTMAYMSPEQVRGLQADARSDVWALGAVLYEMLTGHPPFRGSHAEAIGYAVRNETPPPVRSERPEVPEDVEQLVFRAVHKEPGVRYQSGRDFARALRLVRGLSVPVELRTQPVPVPRPAAPRTMRVGSKAWVLGGFIIALGGVLAWALWPIERIPVAVVPAINQTGYSELDDYRMALTEELESQLADLKNVRVLPHHRLLEIVRPFRQESRDISSREALQAIATHSGAHVLIVPTLLRENERWKVRLDFRIPETAANQGSYETPPVVSALTKETVHGLVAQLAPAVFEHFTAAGPRRAAVSAAVARALGRTPRPGRPRLQSLDAARLFEQGIDAYEELEYAASRRAFSASAERDQRNPLPRAWQSRAALLMRQDKDAVDAADQARRLLTDETSDGDRLFIEAVAAEAHRDVMTADARYRALVARYPDEPSWLIELGGFQDRRGEAVEGVDSYHRALRLDGRLLRPHLELCRLYSPSRLNEPALARQQGDLTLTVSRSLQNRGAEAQALWCLTDILREGGQAEKLSARQHAERALEIQEQLQHPFGIARGENYVAVVALLAERDAARALPLLQRTLASARNVGFALLEARTLMNLGVAYDMLGSHSGAFKAYRASYEMSEALGNSQDAARSQINAATILVDYGDPQSGLRDTQNALAVFQDLHDKDFEVHARRVIGSYYRHVGDYDEATRQLSLGLTIAQERNIGEKVNRLTIELARARFDAGDYVKARELLLGATKTASGVDRVQARLELGRTHTRLGEFAAAEAQLEAASSEIRSSGDVGSRPLLNHALGELQYERDRPDDARRYFLEASNAWSDDDLAENASVEARAYLGWLTALRGERETGTALMLQTLQRARAHRRVAIEARSLVFLARAAVRAGDFTGAMQRLGELTEQSTRVLSPELQAQCRYWRGVAQAGRDTAGAADDTAAARDLIDTWLQRVIGAPYQAGVRMRSDIRLISQGLAVR